VWYGRAAEALQRVVDHDNHHATARTFLRNTHWGRAAALDKLARHAEAADAWQHAAEFHGSGQMRFEESLNNFGVVLRDEGILAGAAVCFRKAIELDPKYALAVYNLGVTLRADGKLDEAVAKYREAVRLDPGQADAHDQLCWSLRLQGKLDEAVAFGKEAVKLKPGEANYHNSLAYALWDQGQLDEAIAEFREAVRLDPQFAAASANLAEAELMAAMRDKLPALDKGEFTPRTTHELRAMDRYCKIKKLFLAGARMYAAAFADDPKLADDLNTFNRYNAACYAALAAAGVGNDELPPDPTQKAELRRQALTWLRADLEARAKQLESDRPEDRKTVGQWLRHWRQDSDLAGLRDGAELAQLPDDERQACRKLWADVQTLLDKAEATK